MSILEDTVFVGAAGDDDLGSGAGAVYVYELSSWFLRRYGETDMSSSRCGEPGQTPRVDCWNRP